MFSVTGKLNGFPDEYHTLEWDDGRLTGEPWLVLIAESESAAREGQPLGPVEGPFSVHDHLRDSSGIGALNVLFEMFEPGTARVSGDIPSREPLPDGAV